MIIGVLGTMGSGKTLLSTYFSYLNHKNHNSVVYSNYWLSFPFEYFSLKVLKDYFSNNDIKDCTFLLDEVDVWFNSRSSSSKDNKLVGFWIKQLRKRRVNLIYTSQYFSQVEKRIRLNTDTLIMAEKIKNKGFLYKIYKKTSLGTYIHVNTKMLKLDKAKKIFKLYDTEEIIGFDDL